MLQNCLISFIMRVLLQFFCCGVWFVLPGACAVSSQRGVGRDTSLPGGGPANTAAVFLGDIDLARRAN